MTKTMTNVFDENGAFIAHVKCNSDRVNQQFDQQFVGKKINRQQLNKPDAYDEHVLINGKLELRPDIEAYRAQKGRS